MIFDWPVGTAAERIEHDTLPGAWFAATWYGQRYDATGKWAIHTGLDLNLNMPHYDADAHAPVYAAESGVVVYAGKLPVWGSVITLRHAALNERTIWTRYAHVEQVTIKVGALVTRGEQIARVGNADGRYPYHLHYDLAWIDLGARPGDWPGDDLRRVERDYLDPMIFTRLPNALEGGEGARKARLRITAAPSLRVRSLPALDAPIVGNLPFNFIVDQLEGRTGWGRVDAQIGGKRIAGWISLAWTKPAG